MSVAGGNTIILAAAGPPEVCAGGEEEQGVQARARWPVTLSRGARTTPCSVAPTAARRLDRPFHHAVRGIGVGLRRARAHCLGTGPGEPPLPPPTQSGGFPVSA